MSTISVHRIIHASRAEGPGLRAVLWVQGCSRHCPGCAVPQTWNPQAGTLRTVESLVEELTGAQITSGEYLLPATSPPPPALDGITFLGGEPFEQADALAELAEILRHKGFSVITFTGFTLQELQSAHRSDYDRLIAATDLLIDGAFVQELASSERPWVGSSNQQYHFLTERSRQWEEQLGTYTNRIEVRISPDGTVSLNGLSAMETWNKVKNAILPDIK